MVDLWEDLETGPNPPEEIYAVVECLKGERNKYEYDKDVPGVVLDRVLHSNVHYPSDYGFIPGRTTTTAIRSTCWCSSKTRRSPAVSSRPARSR